MSRRRLVIYGSACGILGLFMLGLAGVLLATRTSFGRERIRRIAEGRLKSAIHGKVYLGHISGSLLTDITIDSLELRETNDSLFLAAGHVQVRFNPRDLFDMRLVMRDMVLSNVVLNVDVDSAGTVNFRRIFPPGKPGPPRTGRFWGDYIALYNTEIRNLTLVLRTPWEPADTLRGVRRDSAIAQALGREDKEIRRRDGGFVHVMRWSDGRVVLDSARLDDRVAGGRFLAIRNLDLNGSDPPLNFRNLKGTARMLGDSLFTEVAHFDLPASTGSAKGKIWWGGNAPIRYDLAIVGDSVSLADVAWVYPTLPRTGGGRLKLDIRSERDPRVVDYILSDMDVRSTDSWLRGRMTFGIGAPVTILKDVDLVAQPVDFALIEALSGAPLAYPWRGTLTGTVKARGGPLNRFIVDASDIVFRDANVPGAVAVGRGQGELDILEPSFTQFRDFNVDLDQLDLRTLQFLNAGFPRLNGIVAGRATLDSSWLDVRFRGADLTHSDGTGPVTRVTGAGRVTFGDFVTYDVALNATPLSFTTLAGAYTESRIPLRGEYQGPVRLQGTLADLDVSTELRGPSGIVAYDGRVDADSSGGYAFQGALRFGALNLRTFLDTAITPATDLTGRADLDVSGDSLATLEGTAIVELERSFFDSLRIYPSRARMRFGDRRVHVDTLHVESVIATVSAKGGLGLAPDVKDSLLFTFSADSLGGFRRYLTRAPAADGAGNDGDAAAPEVVDSLKARVVGGGALWGSVDTLAITAAVDASEVDAAGAAAKVLRLKADFANLRGKPRGTAELTADTATIAGIRLASVGATAHLIDGRSGDFSVLASAINGPVVKSSGALDFAGDTTTVRLQVLDVSMREHRLSLAGETRIRVEPKRFRLDTLRLVGELGETIAFAGDIPADGAIRALFRVDSVHLADFSDLAQMRVPLGGALTGSVDFKGTRDEPEIAVKGTVNGGAVGDVKIARIELDGRYAHRRMAAELELFQEDSVVASVTSSIPVDLALAPRSRRVLDDTLRVSMRSRDVDMRLIESFSTKLTRTSGRFSANLDLVGPTNTAILVGNAEIRDGAASVPDLRIGLRQINANVVARNDSVLVENVSMVSGTENDDRLTFDGRMARPLHDDRSFDLRFNAQEFRAMDNKRLAMLVISTNPPLRLVGSWNGPSRLTGTVVVNNSVIYMPAASNKQVITLEPEDLAGLDTAAVARLQLLPKAPPAIVRNLVVDGVTIRMGPNVWLRSAESREMNVKLGGAVSVTTGGRARDGTPQLALSGELLTERGTYLLNLASIVQKTFTIEAGQLRFFDDPEFNPVLDIRAVNTVTQVSSTYGGRNDVRIRARIRGTLLQPNLKLESADSLQLSESDLISYLVFGSPSFDISGELRQNTSAILLGSAVNWGASQLGGRFGLDYVQIQTAADQLQLGNQAQVSAANLLKGSQLGIGKQVNDRTFVSLNAGVCQFLGTSGRGPDPATIAQNIGVKVEYQIRPQLGVAGSLEPSLSSLLCGATRGFSTSVRQAGFDLFRTFRW